jgi:hypothetical protein
LNTIKAPEGFSAIGFDTEEIFKEIDNNIFSWIPTFLKKGFSPFEEEWNRVRRFTKN